MNKILADLEFGAIISEAQARTQTGENLLNRYKSFCMNNECSCKVVNQFVKEASQCVYDNDVKAILEQVADYINTNKVRWQIASVCEDITSNNTSYNYLNRNAAKQAEKLLDLNEDEAIKYIKAGALKNVMYCESFRSIAKSVFKNQPMLEACAEYTTLNPVSIVEKQGDDVYFEVLGTLYKINEEKQVENGDWKEVSNNFRNIASLLESSMVSVLEDTIEVTVNNFKYQISEANKVTKLSKDSEKEMTVEQLREDNRLMVMATNNRYKNQMANTLECIAQLCEAYEQVAQMDNVKVITSKNDKFVVIESEDKLYASLLQSNHNPRWTINESAMKALDFIKSKTKIDLSENYQEAVKKNVAQISEEEKIQMEKDLKEKNLNEMKERIATLTEKFKNDPARLAVLSKMAQELAQVAE